MTHESSALFIGRFQPFHNGHLSVIKKILEKSEQVIILIGSAEKAHTKINPFTSGERFLMIENALKKAGISAEKYHIVAVRDIDNPPIWVKHINLYLPPYNKVYTGSKLVKTCYKEFNDFEVEIVDIEKELDVCATKIREKMLEDEDWQNFVPDGVAEIIDKIEGIKRLKNL